MEKIGAAGEFDLAIPKARVFKTLVYTFHHSGILKNIHILLLDTPFVKGKFGASGATLTRNLTLIKSLLWNWATDAFKEHEQSTLKTYCCQ